MNNKGVADLKLKIRIPIRNRKFIDKKCPFYGNVSIRGQILKGEIVSKKMKSSIVVRIDHIKYLKKFNRFIKRHKNVSCHISSVLNCNIGDTVLIGECRYKISLLDLFLKILGIIFFKSKRKTKMLLSNIN